MNCPLQTEDLVSCTSWKFTHHHIHSVSFLKIKEKMEDSLNDLKAVHVLLTMVKKRIGK